MVGVRERRQKQRRPDQEHAEGRWYLKGFSTSPGCTKLVVGEHSVGSVESQVWVQGAAGKKVWLGVKLAKDKWSVTGWMFSEELQRVQGGVEETASGGRG